MFDMLLSLLGFKRGESLEKHLDRYSSLCRIEREGVMDAYGEQDLTSSPANHLAQLALNLWRSNRHEDALVYYTRAIEQAPTDSSLLLNRGNLHFELGNVTAAVADFERAMRGHPKLPDSVFVNYQMVQTLGEDSPILLGLFERLRKKREEA
jgi:tetratricopeptide (TPR) repeat protein